MKTYSTANVIDMVADQTGKTKREVKQIIDSTFDTISNILQQGDRIQLAAFGTLETRERQERMGQNPRTKESIIIPATKTVGFRPAGKLKEAVIGRDD